MRNHYQKGYYLIFTVVIIISIVSCSFFEHEQHSSLTAPGSPEQLTNFFAGRGTSDHFEVHPGRGFIEINIPAAGDYHLLYLTNFGAFDLVLRSTSNALVTIFLSEGDQFVDASLQPGTIIGSVAETLQSGAVTLFAWPGSPVKWNEIFIEGAAASAPISTSPLPQTSGRPIVIAAIGDSITFGSGSGAGGYPVMLEAKLRAAGYDVVVRNQGIPGEQAHATDARFQSVINGADIVLLMIGTNDLVDPVRCPEPYNCHTVGHIVTMLDKALHSNIVPFVSTVTPAQSFNIYNRINSEVRNLNAWIYTIAAERNVTVVDNYNAIMWSGGDFLFSDALHFTDQGYDVIAWQWYNALVASNILRK